MAVIIICQGEDPEGWRAALEAELPELEFRVWPRETGPAEDIDVAVVWQPPPGLFATFPGLKGVLSLGAGVEHVLDDPALPRDVPVVRLIDPGLRSAMVEFVAMEVLRHHRQEAAYRRQQSRREWKLLHQPLASSRRVGILGLGHLGRACADALRDLGFRVSGWSSSARSIEGIETYAGEQGLFPLVERSEILVCLLPLTAETEDIVDATLLGALPRGATLVNAGRGRHVVEEDLLDALDSGQLSHATLDVFRDEPLSPDHPFWTHPGVTLFPHAAAWALPEDAAAIVAASIMRALAGEPLPGEIDRGRGY